MKDSRIWLLTEQGILDEFGDALENTPFHGQAVTAGISGNGSAVVIIDSHEVWQWDGTGWVRICRTRGVINCVVSSPSGKLLLGMADARVSQISGDTVQQLEQFDAIPERESWDTPWGGPPDVRSFAVSSDGTLYANIHVGWIARSRDDGKTWTCVKTGLEKDVHQVATHAGDPSMVMAATARGFHVSTNYGESFERLSEPMPYYYQRACASFPHTDIMLCTTSRGPHGQADSLLLRSVDRGKRWQRTKGLPEGITENLDTYQLVTDSAGNGWICVENHQVLRSKDFGDTWAHCFNSENRVNALMTV